jgi:hypothetical protein
VGSNLAESNGSLRAIKVCSMTSFIREVKASAPCPESLGHILLLSVSAVTRADKSGDELGMMRTQMGSTIDQKM